MMHLQTQTCKYCFGIDIGGTTIKTGLFLVTEDFDLQLIKKDEIKTNKTDCGSHILDDIVQYVNEVLLEENISHDNIIGLGIGVPGSVTDDGVVNKCVNLGWGVINVKRDMQLKSGFNVSIGNDANMAALGEYYGGGACKYTSLAFITIGTGVGGGAIIDGKPLNGFYGAACEIGHIPLVTEIEEQCTCGKTGCLEQIASATGIVKTASQILKSNSEASVLRSIENITAKDIFDAAKSGDKIAEQVVEKVSRYLGVALACVSGIIDPQCIIIGGGVSSAGEYFFEKIRRYYKENVFHPSRETKIIGAQLGNEAGMYGAARLIIDNYRVGDLF